MMLHPEHDRLADAVRGWYTRSYPEMGYQTEQRRFGFYSRNPRVDSDKTNSVTLRPPSAFSVTDFICDLGQYYGGGRVNIWVDDPRMDEEVGHLLEANGCCRETATVYLAHVGTPCRTPPVPGVTAAPVTAADVEEYAAAKLMAFSSKESRPSADEVRANAAIVAAEISGRGRFLITRCGTEAVAVIAWYEGPPDRFIFQVGTRKPFRRRGIASHLISGAAAEAAALGYRSTIINADADDTVVNLYHRLGFTDQVFWRQGYRFPGGSA